MSIDFGFSSSLQLLQTPRAKSIVTAIANPTLRNICVSGPVGTGKTFTILTTLHYLCMTRPGTKIAIARAEKTTLYNTLIPSFRKILANGLRNCSHYSLYGGEKRPQEVHYKNGSKILFTGADNDKIFGGEYSIIYLNELRLIDDVKYSDILGRLRGGGYIGGKYWEPNENYLLLSDTNPSGPNSWIKARERDGRLLLIPTSLEDNPEYFRNGIWTPAGEEYKRVLAEAYGIHGWQFLRYVRGLWVAAEGAIWPGYDPEIHDIDFEFDDVPKDWKWSGSADYGVNHPAVYQLWATSPDRKTTWMFKEIYRTGLTEYRLSQEIKKLHAAYNLDNRQITIVGDTAGDGNQTLLDAGLKVRDANKEVIYGLDIGRQFFDGLGERSVRFNRKSIWGEPDGVLLARGHPIKTTQEIPEYSYKPIEKQTSGDYRDEKPDKTKGRDDGCDALRYHLVDISSTVIGDIPIISGKITPEEEKSRWM